MHRHECEKLDWHCQKESAGQEEALEMVADMLARKFALPEVSIPVFRGGIGRLLGLKKAKCRA